MATAAECSCETRSPGNRHESAYEFKDSFFSSHSQLLNSLPAEGTGQRLLDVGCATGYLSAFFCDRGYRVTGIERPGVAGATFPDAAELVEHDLDVEWPTMANGFDYVVCGDVLEHLRDPLMGLRSIKEKLTPTGTLVASLPNSGNIYFRMTVLTGHFPSHDRGLFDRTHLHYHTWAGWRSLFEDAGFHIECAKVTSIPVRLAIPQLYAPVATALECLFYGLARMWKRLFAYQFVIVARRKLG